MKYKIVKTISTFEHYYSFPFNETDELSNSEIAELITNNERLEEFAQEHIGEGFVSSVILSEAETLEFFDRKCEYLKAWSTEQKLDFLNTRKVK